MLDQRPKQSGKAPRVADLILHVVVSVKDRKVAQRIGFHDRISVFEVILDTAECEIGMLLQLFGEGRERLVLQTVRELAAQIAVFEHPSCGDEIRLDGIVVAPHDFFERFALRPIQASDRKIQERRHDPTRRLSDLRELTAVEIDVTDGRFCLRKERYSQVCADGRCDRQGEAHHALLTQKAFDLPYLVRLALIGLSLAVDRGCGQDAEISVLQMPRDRLTACPRDAHGVEKEHGGIIRVSQCLKEHLNTSVLMNEDQHDRRQHRRDDRHSDRAEQPFFTLVLCCDIGAEILGAGIVQAFV